MAAGSIRIGLNSPTMMRNAGTFFISMLWSQADYPGEWGQLKDSLQYEAYGQIEGERLDREKVRSTIKNFLGPSPTNRDLGDLVDKVCLYLLEGGGGNARYGLK